LHLHRSAVKCLNLLLVFLAATGGVTSAGAHSPAASRSIDVHFSADAIALPAEQRRRLHLIVEDLSGRLRPDLKCPEFAGNVAAAGNASVRRSARQQQRLSLARLEYVRRIYEWMGATGDDFSYSIASPTWLDQPGPDTLQIEARLNVEWDGKGRCAEWLR